jgi:filamentous hemagglutinin
MDDRKTKYFLRRLSVVTVPGLLSAFSIHILAAGIEADAKAPQHQQPIITETASGVTQVNIQTPSSAGVSRNKYQKFDVEHQGAILNNSAQHTQSQLGGWVQRNSLLAGGTARIILNEVNSQNPSLLHGPLEVAGNRAQVVVANPAGISCDGCGFINAHRSTLTTGSPLLNNGKLSGFDVNKGHISITGSGMDDGATAYSDIIARTVKVNSDIRANNLTITSGLNQVTHNNQVASRQEQSGKPAVSIDVAELGGMYADSIHLVGTENGVGVTHAGEIQTQTLVLNAEGQLSLEQDSVVEADQLTANVAGLNNQSGAQLTANYLGLSIAGELSNRGVFDSQYAQIEAARINNISTGAIYADDMVLEANDIHNQSELSGEGQLQGPTIAARNTMKIAAQSLTNEEAAVIYSAGNTEIAGELGDELNLSGAMDSLRNTGGLIETVGNLTLSVLDIENLNAELITAWQTDSVERIIEVQPEAWSRKYDVSRFPKIHNHYVEKQPFVNENGKVIRYFEDYSYYDYYATTESTHLIASKPAKLIAGGDLHIHGDVYNEDSQILAGQNLTISGGSLNNKTTTGQQRISYQGRRQFRDWEGNDEELDFYPWTAYSPAARVTEFNLATTQVQSQSDASGQQTLYSSDDIPALSASWFQQPANVSDHFYIETDPRFTHYRDWLGSDYMLQKLAMDPSLTMKRLGDGFVEQRLVNEQVAQLTGQRFLSGYAEDEAQFMALMDAGVSFARAHELTPGVSLSAEQMAMLTSDIVWLEQQKVQLANGETVIALVPKVYVKVRPEDFQPETGLLAGKQVDIQTGNVIINTGSIAGREVVNLNSDFVQHGGHIQADKVQVDADNIEIDGGKIQAKASMKLDAEQDISIASVTSETSNREGKSHFSRSNIKRVAGLYVSGDGADMNVTAGRNIHISAADIQHAGENGKVTIAAANDLKLGKVKTSESNNSILNTKDFNKHSEHSDIGSRIATKGDISLKADNQLELSAANITSQAGEIAIKAEQVDIKNANASYMSDIASHTERDGTFSSKSKDQRDIFNETTAVASVVSGKTVSVESQSDINITGSQLVADQTLTLEAANDINVTAAEERYEHEQYVNEEESGLLSSGGIGFTIGSQQLDVTDISKQSRKMSSELGSLEGDVTLSAGKNYVQRASDVTAVQGDIDITAASIDIESGTEILNREHTTEFSQSGLSISITNPVISAVQAADQMVEAARETSDPRMKALAAATIGLNANNAYNKVLEGQGTTINGKPNQIPTLGANGKPSSRDANAADNVGGINLAISIGSSESSSQRKETIKQAHSSKLAASGDITISAVGDGDNSDLTVKGSEIQAGKKVSLKADDDLNLIAAENTRKLQSENDSSSGSVGISIGTDGLLFTAGMSKGEGQGNGQDRSWTETTIRAGEQVALESGADTVLKGAVVSGDQVTANVGDDLTIHSLQDSSQYQSEQENIGVSISVGAGRMGGSLNFGTSDIESDYVSVIEQSGIKAGGKGFQVEVEGNTGLTGAVIASTEEAVQQENNSFETGTLTLSDLKNKAEYDAEAKAMTIAMGTQSGEPQLSGAGIGRENDNVNSVTTNSMSKGVLKVRDNDATKELTGEPGESDTVAINRDVYVNDVGQVVTSSGVNTANSIDSIFDAKAVADEINAQVEITQAFGQQAYKVVGDYVQTRRGNLLEELASVQTETEKAAVKKQLDDLLLQERVMNILIGALSGNGGSAVTKESLSVAAGEMREIMIAQSKLFAGVTDGETTLTNKKGPSEGVRGDGFKLGGTRIDLDILCGVNNKRCVTNEDGSLYRNSDERIVFKGDLEQFMASDEGKKLAGPTGGIQGWTGTLFGISYEPGSWQDKLIEAFSGSHDMIGGQLTGLYNEQGNATRGRSKTKQNINNTMSVLALAPSTPFAMAELLPPRAWQAISILLGEAK